MNTGLQVVKEGNVLFSVRQFKTEPKTQRKSQSIR